VENLLQRKIILVGSDPSFLVPRSQNDRTKAATKENKKNKKKKPRVKKKIKITFEEECVPPIKTPFTLGDYIPKGFFDSDSLDDDLAEGKYPNVVWCHDSLSGRKRMLSQQISLKKWTK